MVIVIPVNFIGKFFFRNRGTKVKFASILNFIFSPWIYCSLSGVSLISKLRAYDILLQQNNFLPPGRGMGTGNIIIPRGGFFPSEKSPEMHPYSLFWEFFCKFHYFEILFIMDFYIFITCISSYLPSASLKLLKNSLLIRPIIGPVCRDIAFKNVLLYELWEKTRSIFSFMATESEIISGFNLFNILNRGL